MDGIQLYQIGHQEAARLCLWIIFSKALVAAAEKSRTQRDKRALVSRTQEEYNRVKTSVFVAVLAK